MEANSTVIDALLRDYLKNPTGFSAGQTIKYGLLSTGFLESRLSAPKPESYPLGASDPAYQQALDTWQKNYGKDFAAASKAQMAQIAKAFAAWEKVLGVTFVRDDANAQIRFGVGDLTGIKSSDGVTEAAGYNVRQFTGNAAADYNVVVMPRSSDTNMDGAEWAPGDGRFATLLHEIGHALGLAHPGNYASGIYAGPEDNTIDTLMSYRSIRPYPDVILDGYGSVLQSQGAASATLTPARYDILALQQSLGVNAATSGNGNRFDDFKDAYIDPVQKKWVSLEYRTIFDAGKDDCDVIDASSIASNVKINLEPGTASSIGAPDNNIVIAFNAWELKGSASHSFWSRHATSPTH